MRTLVIGGTGTVGSEVVKGLLAAGEEVYIMTRRTTPRHVAGARYVRGDLDHPATVRAAMQGMDRVFLLVAQGPAEQTQGVAAVEAARAARVERLVYMGVGMPGFAAEVPHFASKQAIEAAIRGSGLSFTLLRPNNFFQNDLTVFEVIVRYGLYPLPIGGKGVARVDVRDIADGAVTALLRDGHAGETYAMNGPELLTGASVAEAYAHRLARPVGYAGDSLEVWANSVSQFLPGWLVSDLCIMYAKFQEQGMPSTPHDDDRFRTLLGRPPRGFASFVAEAVETAALKLVSA